MLLLRARGNKSEIKEEEARDPLKWINLQSPPVAM
jgi:hypothetical protein